VGHRTNGIVYSHYIESLAEPLIHYDVDCVPIADHLGDKPLSSPCPLLSSLCRENRGRWEEVCGVGGCAACLTHPFFSPPHAAERCGEGARGWGYFADGL